MAVLVLVAVFSGLWSCVPGSGVEPPPGRPRLTACKEPGMPAEALCGTYEVFENRESRVGRKIPLRITVRST